MFTKKIWKHGTPHFVNVFENFYQRQKLTTRGLRNGKPCNCVNLMLREIIPFTNSIMYSLQCHVSL